MVGEQQLKNQMELWKELDEAALRHDVNWKWVRAHSGNTYNEEADRLARKETKKLKYRSYEIEKPSRRNSKSAAASRMKPSSKANEN